jgi:hypothetical protein
MNVIPDLRKTHGLRSGSERERERERNVLNDYVTDGCEVKDKVNLTKSSWNSLVLKANG